ncbi:MAG: UvrD-helicase domain-containing protein, partial [Clostridia bacterium]|nr:UvrD-helicase domain-containing protein [Clostridia bacterium]
MDNYTPSQRAAIFHEGGNLLVSASAGSGKTFVMISRVIDLILSGKAEVKEILAVTYTNLAAEEMKQKLVKELVKGIAEGKNVERLKRALSDVADADFSTFHGFLGKVLRSYFYACGLDPLYAIADETEAKELKNLAIERLFDKKYRSADEDFLYLARIYRRKRGDGDLKDMVLKLSDFASSEASPEEFFEKGVSLTENFKSFYKKLSSLYREKLTALITLIEKTEEGCEFSGAEKYAAYAKDLSVSAKLALSSLTAEDFKEISLSLAKMPSVQGKDEILSAIGEELKEEKKELSDIVSAANEWLLSPKEREKDVLATARAAKTLTILAKEFDEEYSKIKRAENKADFNDLERISLNLLRSHEEIRAEISDRYKYVFADEYQDVNGVQEEILGLIAKDNLFMVGDVKQSIYAFRGCNPEIFAEKYDNYLSGSGGKALSLDKNFRSSDGVLSAVNNVFSHVITREFGGIEYSENPMSGCGLYKDYKGGATLHILDGEKQKKEKASGIYSVLKAFNDRDKGEDFYEGALAAKIIESELGKPIFDLKTGKMRETAYGDIAVLTRNSKGFTTKVVKELSKYFIPVTSEAGENLLDYPEIKLLIDVMKLISFYADDAPLAATLTSAVGKLDEEDLAEIRRPYSRRDKSFADCVSLYEKEGENAALREKLKNFREYFEKIRLLSEFTGAGEILARVMKDTGLDLEINGMPLGEMRIGRVEKFLSESVVGGKPLSVNEFLKRIEYSPKDLTLSPKGGENTVKVMSIHASKGLEFPVVIVAGLKKNFSSESRKGEILFDRGLGFALKSYDEENKTCSETLIRQYFKEKIKLDAIKEEARIFYVATTRAKCRLHLIADCDIQEEFSHFSLLSAGKFADFICKRDMPVVYHDREEL